MKLRRHKHKNRKRESNRPHLQWVRGFQCCVPNCSGRPVIPHHVRSAGNAGMGEKDDRYAVPLCNDHHISGHQIGWRTFEAKHGLDLEALAEQLWRDDRAHGAFKEEQRERVDG